MCNGEPAAAQPIAEYMTVVQVGDPAAACLRCMYCADRGEDYHNTCWWCSNELNADQNAWDAHYNNYGQRHPNDPNPLRPGERIIRDEDRKPGECPSCGDQENWSFQVRVDSYEWYDFDANTQRITYSDSDGGGDWQNDPTYTCVSCDWEVPQPSPFYDELDAIRRESEYY